MNRTKILIIEDEEAIADLLAYGLGREGFETRIAGSGTDGLRELQQFEPDLLVLDWMLPDRSGLDICRQVTAQYNIPILMLTARSDITDKILGLEVGADDYITKPFDLREVVARIRTILRRLAQAQQAVEEASPSVIGFRDIIISPAERLVTKHGETVDLTPKEFDLLMALLGARGKIFTRAELLQFIWGYDFPGDMRTVDTHIQRLRKKLDAADLITTVFGIGYKFEKRTD
ncbi:DNA-binding response regulator, OmpR family, contains REC and winged-helix (wHTH) domain [Paenibacillus catalpae]|uniref:DNA-binding response regulator, OmpR family, contains REC and winged-helix (WHTH) domain n=1 Tax=Paenibacillus catalpae TaxID=1045775 RepID=A0A1I1UZ52_9BACL|nr:response regulator transcription factor [Paenibacillus catalpae]SFD76071.1 DNA-binding response regulator, OmpR family, contains REC and winged-helix (wHTH) domain [Paenibacillus catalpae]